MDNLDNDLLISAYLDGEVTAEERAHVEQLLATSAEARLLVEELRALRESLKALPKHSLGAGFAQQVLARAQQGSHGVQSASIEVAEVPADEVKELPQPAQFARPFSGRRGITWSLVAAAAAVIIVVANRNQPKPQNQNLADRQKERVVAQAPQQVQQQLAEDSAARKHVQEMDADGPSVSAAAPTPAAAPIAVSGMSQGNASQTPAFDRPSVNSIAKNARAVPLAATPAQPALVADMPVASAEPSMATAGEKTHAYSVPPTNVPGAAGSPLGKIAADNEQFGVGRDRTDGIAGSTVGKLTTEEVDGNQSSHFAVSGALAGDAKPGTIASGSITDRPPAMTGPADGGKPTESPKVGDVAADEFSGRNFARGLPAGSGAIAGGASSMEGVNKSFDDMSQTGQRGLELQAKTADVSDLLQRSEPGSVLFVEVTLSAEAARGGDFERLLKKNNIVLSDVAIDESAINSVPLHDRVGLQFKDITATDLNSTMVGELGRDLVPAQQPAAAKTDARVANSNSTNEGKFDLTRDQSKKENAAKEAETRLPALATADSKKVEVDRNGDGVNQRLQDDHRLAVDQRRLFDYQRDASGANANIDLVYVEASPQEIRETLAEMKQSPDLYFSVSLLGDRAEKFGEGERSELALDFARRGRLPVVDRPATEATNHGEHAAAPADTAEKQAADKSKEAQAQSGVAKRAALPNQIAGGDKSGRGGGAPGSGRGGFGGGSGNANGFGGGGGRGAGGRGGQFGSSNNGSEVAKDSTQSQNGQFQSNEIGKNKNQPIARDAAQGLADESRGKDLGNSQGVFSKPASESADEKLNSVGGTQPAEPSQEMTKEKSPSRQPSTKENLAAETKSATMPPNETVVSGLRQKAEGESLGRTAGNAYRLKAPKLEVQLGLGGQSAAKSADAQPSELSELQRANVAAQKDKSVASSEILDATKANENLGQLLHGGNKALSAQPAVPTANKPESTSSLQIAAVEKAAALLPNTMERAIFVLRIVDNSSQAAGASQTSAARESKADVAKPNAAVAPLNTAPTAAPVNAGGQK